MANLLGTLFDSNKKSHWAVAVLFLSLGAVTAQTYASVTQTKTELRNKADNDTIKQMLEQNNRLIELQQAQMEISRMELRALEIQLNEVRLRSELGIGELKLEQRSLASETTSNHDVLLKAVLELKESVQKLQREIKP